MSHDIRTPLTGIVGLSEALIEENSKEDKIIRKIASRNFSNTSFVKIKINDEIEKYVHISFSNNGNIEE